MHRRRGVMAALAVLSIATNAWGSLYLWTPGDGYWDLCAYWTYVGAPEIPCYPADTGDDVIIALADDSEDSEIELNDTTYTIDDMTVTTEDAATVNFPNYGGIYCETLTVYGPTEGTGRTQVICQTQTFLTTG